MISPFFLITFLAITLLFTSVGALPLPEIPEAAKRDLEARAVTLMSAATISDFTPFTQFARVAYCPQSKVNTWSCGGELSPFSRFDRNVSLNLYMQEHVMLFLGSNRL
jgi:hypothetical protein